MCGGDFEFLELPRARFEGKKKMVSITKFDNNNCSCFRAAFQVSTECLERGGGGRSIDSYIVLHR